jgi:cytochrome b561
MSNLGHASASRYSSTVQFLHWLTAALVVVAFIVSVGGPEARVYSAERDYTRSLHELLGVAVFAATVLRLLWRLVDRPPQGANIPRWMQTASRSVQGMLYALLLMVPLTAVFGAWLEGHPLTLLGIGSVASIVAESHPLGRALSELHGWVGDVLIWLAGFHAAAGLYHHFGRRDDVLRSMLPGFDQP